MQRERERERERERSKVKAKEKRYIGSGFIQQVKGCFSSTNMTMLQQKSEKS